MDPLTIASIGLPIVSGILGSEAASGAKQNAENDMKRALAAYTNINLPDKEKMRLALEQYQSQGNLAPSTETAQILGDTALQNINLNPKYNEATMSALAKMSQIAEQGLPEADRAQLQNILNETNQQNTSNQKAILENRAARGMGGSGDELASQLASAQSGANNASNQALQLAAIAAQRKLDAADRSGNLGNTLQQAEYGRQKDLYGKQDAISEFNANQKQNSQMRNVDRSNRAQEINLAANQGLSNSNVNLRNEQQKFNKGLEQNQFENELKRASGVSAGYQNMAGLNAGQAADTAKMFSGIGGSLATGLMSLKPKPEIEDNTQLAGKNGLLGMK